MSPPCEHCEDEDGIPCYPMYGLAPHVHEGPSMIGSTRFLPKSEWPDNFTPDADDEIHGIYHCPKCGEGKP